MDRGGRGMRCPYPLREGEVGGHMGRKGDGMPAWIPLWRGMSKMQALVKCGRLAQQVESFG